MNAVGSGRMGRRRGLMVMVALILVALAACGVPNGGKPIVDGQPRANVAAGPGAAAPPPQPKTFPTNQPLPFVTSGYLAAIAGQGTQGAQTKAAKAFMAPGARWHAGTTNAASSAPVAPVTMVRILTSPNPKLNPDGTFHVSVNVQVVGSFDPSAGAIVPASSTAKPIKLAFVVGLNSAGDQLQIESAPTGFYLTADAFFDRYEPQTIYFSDGVGGLIPDQRYLPNAMTTSAQRATQVVQWILAGPPDWIAPAATPLVKGVGLADPFVGVDSHNRQFVVNLSLTTMSPQQAAYFVAEVRWSLEGIPLVAGQIGADDSQPPAVALKFPNGDKPIDPSVNQIASNQATDRAQDPIAYAIEGGKVRAIGLGSSFGGVDVKTVPYDDTKSLSDPKNSNVVSAAIRNRDGFVSSALVRQGAHGQELWVSQVRDTTKAKYVRVRLNAKTFARPVWLAKPAGALAVVADGKFYVVKDTNNNPTVAPIAISGPGSIQTFSVGSDGHRLALVSNGQVWVGILSIGSDTPPLVTTARRINLAPQLKTVSAVAWSLNDQLAAGGTDGTSAQVIETYADGYYTPTASLHAYAAPAITELASYPLSPLDINSSSPVMVQTSNRLVWAGRSGPVALNQKLKDNGTPSSPFFED
jgi:hypothetical protein